MALKTVLETLDGVDDAIKSFYTEADGRFVLDVTGVDEHPDVANLKSAYERVKASEKDAKATAKKAADDLADAIKGQPDAEALVKLRTELEGRITALTTENDGLKGQITGATRDRALSDALAGSGVTNPAFVKAATALLAGSVKMVDGKAIVETDMGPVGIDQHVKRWAAGEGSAFVSAPSGGGAKGNGNNQPAPTKRSEMTAEQKHAYQTEHGQAAYLKLPK